MSSNSGPLALSLAIWTWLVIGVCSLACFLLQLVLAPLTWPFDRNRVITGRLYRIMGAFVARLTPLWDFQVAGRLPARKPGRTVVVSNHCSQTDPFLISHLPWEMKWLGKASLFRIPVVGWSMWLAGDVPVVRGEKQSAKGAMARCARYLERGMPVMIFPEGTRSPTGTLGVGQPGVGLIALRSRAPILPVAITGTESLPGNGGTRGASARRRRATAIHFGPPFVLPESVEGRRLSSKDATERIMAELAKLLPTPYRS